MLGQVHPHVGRSPEDKLPIPREGPGREVQAAGSNASLGLQIPPPTGWGTPGGGPGGTCRAWGLGSPLVWSEGGAPESRIQATCLNQETILFILKFTSSSTYRFPEGLLWAMALKWRNQTDTVPVFTVVMSPGAGVIQLSHHWFCFEEKECGSLRAYNQEPGLVWGV